MSDLKIAKILIVVDSIDVNDSSASKGRVALIKNLHTAGFDVKVYHYTQKNIQLPGIECVLIPEKKWSVLFILSRIQRIFTRLTGIHFHKFLEGIFGFSFTFFNDVNSIVNSLKKEKKYQPDLVLTLSKGTSFRPHYALLKLPKLHNKWMAYVHDPYPYHFYPKPYNWVEPGFRKKEQFFKEVSEKSRFSIFPSQLLKEWMGSYFPNFLKTGVVIPHQNMDVDEKEMLLPSFFNVSKFNLLHAGNLMKQRSPQGLIEGFLVFLVNNPEAKEYVQLILIGSASNHKKMLKEYENQISELVVQFGNLPFNTVYELQKQTSVNIILESKAEISPFLPGKFPHCIKANKPIILLAPHYSETKRLLGSEYPYIAEVDDIAEIAVIIQKLYKKWLENPSALKLDRPDLEHYISASYLKEVIISLKGL